jgi:hypothetical protein
MSKRRPTPLVDRLPLRPPFTKDEWGKGHLLGLAENPIFLDYFERCLTEVVRSPRIKVYMSRLVGIMHAGRLVEFAPRSYGKFFEEAENQPVSVPKLEMALDTILEGLANQLIRMNPVEQFEFLAFIADFGRSVGEHFGMTERMQTLTRHATSTALLSFIVAVNQELGIGK